MDSLELANGPPPAAIARPSGVGGIKVVGLLEIKRKSFGQTHRHIADKQTNRQISALLLYRLT